MAKFITRLALVQNEFNFTFNCYSNNKCALGISGNEIKPNNSVLVRGFRSSLVQLKDVCMKRTRRHLDLSQTRNKGSICGQIARYPRPLLLIWYRKQSKFINYLFEDKNNDIVHYVSWAIRFVFTTHVLIVVLNNSLTGFVSKMESREGK